ncbi:hypothetical protein [Luteitalea sp.]|uniref:hypothetical protein n=1 Tax=Luteitalea sp. TaxID=2004800 RepID=UPI0025BCCE11|nr:hypothetical protein [Luteitalea sp.]
MNDLVLDWPSYRSLPYERRLAIRELESLLGATPVVAPDQVRISNAAPDEELLSRLTYFHLVRFNGSGRLVPTQAKLEASASATSANLFRELSDGVVLRRQSTRYSAHGLHEYKGKFNPQIVRSVVNVLGVGLQGEKPRVLDPFCGSGTSLVESAHMGWDALGIDANPLAVLISTAKLDCLRVPVTTLQSTARRVTDRLLQAIGRYDCKDEFSRTELKDLAKAAPIALPNEQYLEKWFSASVLAQLRLVWFEISSIENTGARRIASVVLSDILRDVSLQDPGDLRIRRRADAKANYPAVRMFAELLPQRLESVARARTVLGKVRGRQRSVLGDSRVSIPTVRGEASAPFDVVVTSPPYATALPYIDTQRLSLAFLGLLPPSQLRDAEARLIGNREITAKERDTEERRLREAVRTFPKDVAKLLLTTSDRAAGEGNGFRRRNVPALLLRYFDDMRRVFRNVRSHVAPGGAFAMVVGPNRTTLSGEEINIDTPRLLASVAAEAGWDVDELVALDAYQRFSVHQENSIKEEMLVVLRAKGD